MPGFRFDIPQRRCLLLLFVVSILFTAGCGQQEETSDTSGLRIAVVPKGTAHVFWQTVHAGAKTAGQEMGAEILWQGTQDETQRERQIAIIEDFIIDQVDGIVLAPQDADALVPAINKVDRAGIPLVIFDSGANTDKYVSFVATDNYKGGVRAAEKMGELLPDGGTVIIIAVNPGSESTTQREQGFEDTIQEKFPAIEILDKQYGYSDREQSRAVTEDLLTKYPEVHAVFGPNESSTFGALLALRAQGYAGKRKFVGFDSSAELNTALENREIHALVLQDPFTRRQDIVAG